MYREDREFKYLYAGYAHPFRLEARETLGDAKNMTEAFKNVYCSFRMRGVFEAKNSLYERLSSKKDNFAGKPMHLPIEVANV